MALGPAHSGISWTAYAGETPVLSGGAVLGGLKWEKFKGKILMAHVTDPSLTQRLLSNEEREYWEAHNDSRRALPRGDHDFGPPPQRWNSLFADGVRQVRARFPNANPQDGTGICFSATNRPGEGCNGYLEAEGSAGQTMPAPGGRAVSMGPNRGSSPTLGCPECGTWGTFKPRVRCTDRTSARFVSPAGNDAAAGTVSKVCTCSTFEHHARSASRAPAAPRHKVPLHMQSSAAHDVASSHLTASALDRLGPGRCTAKDTESGGRACG